MLNYHQISIKLERLLALVLVIILALLISPLLPFKNIIRTYVVVSASMEPKINTGSLAVTIPINPQNLRVGDIVAFSSPDNSKETILHRLYQIKSTKPLRFATKGDNNNSADQWDLVDVGVKGKYIFSIPYLGRLIAFIRQPLGFVLIICLPAILIIFLEVLKIRKALDGEVQRRVQLELRRIPPKPIAVLILFTSIISLINSPKIFAKYTASATLTNLSFSFSSPDTTPPTSTINLENNLQRSRDFCISTSASDISSVKYIELYYSYNQKPWQLFPEKVIGNQGCFNFNSPEGDGLYSFKSQATDSLDNVELVDYSDYFSFQVQVDTIAPTTNLKLDSLSNSYLGQSYLQNGNFNNAMTAWVTDSSVGDHHIVSVGDSTAFLLGFQNLSLNSVDSLYQDFSLPNNSSTSLSFSFRFLSHDIAENDTFNVSVLDTSNNLIKNILSLGNTNSSFDYDSDWQTLNSSLSNLGGQNLRLYFSLTDLGVGNTNNSYVYLTNIKVSTLDPRIDNTSLLNFTSSDLGSGVGSSYPDSDNLSTLHYGENVIDYAAADNAGNNEKNNSQSFTVLLPLVLNKINFNNAVGESDSVEIYNNGTDSYDLSSVTLLINSSNLQIGLSGLLDSHSSLTFYLPDLNNITDKISLSDTYNGETSLLDTTTYAGNNLPGEYWYRSINGLGPWSLKSTLLSGVLTRKSQYKITLSINNIPDFFGKNSSDRLNYEITYGDSPEHQIAGQIFPQSVEHKLSERDFYLGTCSTGGICIPDSNIGTNFTLKLNGQINDQDLNIDSKTFVLEP